MTTNNDTSSISFTAHYTGYVWHHHGLSASEFATPQGLLFFTLMKPFEFLARRLVGSNIQTTLLQRHALIDRELDALIAQHPDLQILEIACGLSPRGHRYCQQHANITYVEADLPSMVARKRALLEAMGSLDTRHRMATCNILNESADDSLSHVIAREFSTDKPLVIITEGLVNYFDLAVISCVWQKMAAQLQHFPFGVYLTDIYPEVAGHRFAGLIRSANKSLRMVSRSRFTLHFANDTAMQQHFLAQGFSTATVFNPDKETALPVQARGGAIVRVVKAQA